MLKYNRIKVWYLNKIYLSTSFTKCEIMVSWSQKIFDAQLVFPLRSNQYAGVMNFQTHNILYQKQYTLISDNIKIRTIKVKNEYINDNQNINYMQVEKN